MDNLTPEQHRVLQKRIVKALDKVKYYPARYDVEELAAEVLRPYAPRERKLDRLRQPADNTVSTGPLIEGKTSRPGNLPATE